MVEKIKEWFSKIKSKLTRQLIVSHFFCHSSLPPQFKRHICCRLLRPHDVVAVNSIPDTNEKKAFFSLESGMEFTATTSCGLSKRQQMWRLN